MPRPDHAPWHRAPVTPPAIHADIEKGFILAGVIACDGFITLGSKAAAKKAGKYRLEGRKYMVLDGDVMHLPVQRPSYRSPN